MKSKTIPASANIRANGKLLLMGEYAVLAGATALACPTKLGQRFSFECQPRNDQKGPLKIQWQALEQGRGAPWFEQSLLLNSPPGEAKEQRDTMLARAFSFIAQRRPELLEHYQCINVRSQLEFPRCWGLGSSSTFLYSIATWADCDPYELLDECSGGSGADIACADAVGPILYSRNKWQLPEVSSAQFYPSFKEQLFFIYTGQKASTQEALEHSGKLMDQLEEIAGPLGELVQSALGPQSLAQFAQLAREHELLLSRCLSLKTALEYYDLEKWPVAFAKHLGAWGGDFILVGFEAERRELESLAQSKEMGPVMSFDEMLQGPWSF
jgi:mevalonate kinase